MEGGEGSPVFSNREINAMEAVFAGVRFPTRARALDELELWRAAYLEEHNH